MKKNLILALCASFALSASAQWKPVGDKIKTEWASQIDPNNVLPEYPRPIMERGEWKNLNGLWNYAIIEKGQPIPTTFEGEILVPFAVESALSGVGKNIDQTKELVYQRSFEVPAAWKGKQVLLHFGAVDWKADVWVNDIKVGSHTGGYAPFSFDITPALSGKNNKLVVKVFDSTDRGYQPCGKQMINPHSIWYTPVSGIWQTVWLEPVAKKHIEDLRILPDIDRNVLTVDARVAGCCETDLLEVNVYDGDKLVATGKSINHQPIEVPMPADRKLWSPDSPFLYTLKVNLKSAGKVVDKVDSYTAMRKFSYKNIDGITRMMLNNEPLFQFGTLDQGWWPDGLYTAPTDEALLFDIQKTKDMGFNMIRKHIKVEPARWYTYCDRLGMIVWQDMPSGDQGRNAEWQMKKYFDGVESKRSAESEANYRKEWKEIMDHLYSYPCIGVWVPFNERWGQFKTQEIAEWTKQMDSSRLVNAASGGNHYPCGDMLDIHNYPNPDLYLYDASRPTVLGEYGGIGYAVKDHLWVQDRNWGYVNLKSTQEATDEYVKYANMLLDLIPKGFSGAVYTQTTDVEVEVNGLMTYDRKVIKLDEARVREINQKICNALKK